jgi:hypothetical protein
MKKFIFSGVLLFLVFSLFAQNPADTIVIKKGLATRYQLNGKNLNPKQLSSIVQSNPAAYNEIKIAKRKLNTSRPFIIVGLPSIIFTEMIYLEKGVFVWPLAVIGVGSFTAGVCFSGGYTKHAGKAVRIYNKGLKYSSVPKPDIKIGLGYNSVGIKIRF